MRISYLTHTLNPKTGAGVFTENLVSGIRAQSKGAEFSVLTSENHIKPDLLGLLRNLPHIRERFREADIIHALDGYPYGVVAAIANLGISKPLVITAVGSGSVGLLRQSGFKTKLLKWAYQKADRVTAISRYVANEIRNVLPDLSIEVINHGVDADFFKPLGTKENDAPYIVTQGEFKRRKGYSEILPIIKKVIDKRPDVKYVIIADIGRNKEYQMELQLLMRTLDIEDRVVIKSGLTREKLRETYQRASLYLSLPKNVDGDVEGFGLSILEAAACGTPSVVGKGSGADDAVSDGKSGFLIDGGDEKLVVEKILSILDNKDLQRKLSDGARKWAEENTWPAKARQYLKFYESR
ncbi:MAG: glycosyltransferase family 4 protein [Minisyncoccia bacterium]